MTQGSGTDVEPQTGDPRRPVTLRDVAARAGVSTATASKALNDVGRMTEDTRQRIRQVAAAMGFRPNALAQSLIRKRSFTVGLLTNDTYGRFSLPVMAGISEALVDAGVSVFLCHVEDDPRLGQLHVQAMLDKQVDGIIATGKRVDRRLPVDLESLGVPVVYAFTRPTPDAAAFVSDDADGAAQAIRHLIGLGRRRIVHVTGPAGFEVVQVRANAARQALKQAGLEAFAPLIGTWSEAWGHGAVARLFGASGRRPDAIFCGNDQIARGVIDALRERGIGVPSDVAVVGFDNWEIMATATRPPLTTIDMNLTALGHEAGETLLALVEGKPVAPGLRKRPCRLVVRESCGAGFAPLESIAATG
jgi:LacI family transcriptional regulator